MASLINTSYSTKDVHFNVKNIIDLVDKSVFSNKDFIKKVKRYSSDYSKTPISLISKVSEVVDFDEEGILKGLYDYSTLENQILHNKILLPNKYNIYANSKLGTIKNIFSILHSSSPHFISFLKKRLQIGKLLDSTQEYNVGPLLLKDVFHYMEKWRFPISSYKCLGKLSGEKYKSLFFTDMPDYDCLINVFEYVIAKIENEIEKNMHYEITKRSDDFFMISSKPRIAMLDTIGSQNSLSLKHCYNVMGWIEMVGEHFPDKKINVKKVSCYHSGDSSCNYNISVNYLQ